MGDYLFDDDHASDKIYKKLQSCQILKEESLKRLELIKNKHKTTTTAFAENLCIKPLPSKL